MKKANIKRLIESVRTTPFNWRNPETCLGGHARRLSGSGGDAHIALCNFIGIDYEKGLRLYQGRDIKTGKRLVSEESWRSYFHQEEQREVAIQVLKNLIAVPTSESLKRANKARRRKAFRESFVGNPSKYRFLNSTNCLVGQLICFANNSKSPFGENQTESDKLKENTIKFFGLNITAEKLERLWGGSEWAGSISFDGAVKTLDEVIFA